MKNYVIGAVLLLLHAFVNGMLITEKINETMYLRGFSIVTYITTLNNNPHYLSQKKNLRGLLKKLATDKLLQSVGTEVDTAERIFDSLITLKAIGNNRFMIPKEFSLTDYVWFVMKPDKMFILRSRQRGDINLAKDPKKLPNFDISNPNFVVVDATQPVVYVEVYIEISLPKFLWNIDEGPTELPQELTTIFDEARKALYPTPTSSAEITASPLPELAQNLLLLGM